MQFTESLVKLRFSIKRGLKRGLLSTWSWTESHPKLRAWILCQLGSVPWLASQLRRIRRFEIPRNRRAFLQGDPRALMPKNVRDVYTDLLQTKK